MGELETVGHLVDKFCGSRAVPCVGAESAIGKCVHSGYWPAGEEGTLLPTPAHSQQAVDQPVMECSDFGQESNEVCERASASF